MAGKIFFRERSKVKEGSQTPRYRIIAISGVDLKIYGNHLREKELEQIAKESGAKLVKLKHEPKRKKVKAAKNSK